MSKHDPLDTEAGTTRNDAVRLARQVEANDWKWLMCSNQGRRIVWRLLDQAGVYRTSFTGNSETFFKEGMRNMGLIIVGAIQAHSPEAYALMLTESKAST